jgi:catechol 2,3-dioxygenase-like lactoylglutathione lyase family enzyme
MADPVERPEAWVGHISVTATDNAQSADFYISLGMREVVRNDAIAVLELRGGTHLVISQGEPAGSAPFDLMVEDIDVAHAQWAQHGLGPSKITRGRIHDRFTILDPAGTEVTINSSHVVGEV